MLTLAASPRTQREPIRRVPPCRTRTCLERCPGHERRRRMATADNRSLGELMAELSRETGMLVRQEVELATTELTSRVKEVAGHAAFAAVGAAMLHAGVLVVLAALVIGLAQLGLQP